MTDAPGRSPVRMEDRSTDESGVEPRLCQGRGEIPPVCDGKRGRHVPVVLSAGAVRERERSVDSAQWATAVPLGGWLPADN